MSFISKLLRSTCKETVSPKEKALEIPLNEFETHIINFQEKREWIYFPPLQNLQPKRFNFTDNNQKQIYGFQIGINYICTRRPLKGCINDALNFRSFLVSNNVPFDNTFFYSDFTSTKPTKSILLDRLSSLSQVLPPNSSLFLSFSGHGTRYNMSHETICALSSDNKTIELILDTEIFKSVAPFFAQNPTSRLFFLADSCFSENVMKLKYTYLPNILLNKTTLKHNKDAEETTAKILLLSGSTRTQTSADVELKNGISHGALTMCFLKFMQEHRHNKVNYQTLLLGLNRELKKHGFAQTSCLSSSFLLDLNQEFLFP